MEYEKRCRECGAEAFEEEKVEQAVALFKEGYNCSQAVSMALADLYDIEPEMMARLTSSFGGGIGRMRETCGAACGIFTLVGLELTKDGEKFPDGELKRINYEVVQELAANFKEQTGSLFCRELLGLGKANVSATPDVRTTDFYRKRPCTQMVEIAVRVYLKWLNEKSLEK